MTALHKNRAQELHFEHRDEHRDWYVVKYYPPMLGFSFAVLNITLLAEAKTISIQDVAEVMENEFHHWIGRYPIPIMVSAFDDTGSSLRINNVRHGDHLLGRLHPESHQPVFSWDWDSGKDLLEGDVDPQALIRIFSDIPYRTGEEIAVAANQKLNEQRRAIRLGRFLLIMWLVVVPTGIAVAGFGSQIIGAALLVYALSKAFVQWMKLIGRWPKSKWTLDREADERQMQHHHYWCKKNPEGFQRLKSEAVDQEQRERIRAEADALKKKKIV